MWEWGSEQPELSHNPGLCPDRWESNHNILVFGMPTNQRSHMARPQFPLNASFKLLVTAFSTVYTAGAPLCFLSQNVNG